MHLSLPAPNVIVGETKLEATPSPDAQVFLGHSFEAVLQCLSLEDEAKQTAEKYQTDGTAQGDEDAPADDLNAEVLEQDEFVLSEDDLDVPTVAGSGQFERSSMRVENSLVPSDTSYDANPLPSERFASRSPDVVTVALPAKPGRSDEATARDRPQSVEGAVSQSNVSALLFGTINDRVSEAGGGKPQTPEVATKPTQSAPPVHQASFQTVKGPELKEISSMPPGTREPISPARAPGVGFSPATISADASPEEVGSPAAPLLGMQKSAGKSVAPAFVPISSSLTNQGAEMPASPEDAALQILEADSGSMSHPEAEKEIQNKGTRPPETMLSNPPFRADTKADSASIDHGGSISAPASRAGDEPAKEPAFQGTDNLELASQPPTAGTLNWPESLTSAAPQHGAIAVMDPAKNIEQEPQESLEVEPAVGIDAFSVSSTQPQAKQALPQIPGIGRQVLQQLTDVPLQANEKIEITLAPEELGRIRLSATQTDQGVVLLVQAERPETLDLMRRHLPLLLQDLQAMGFSDIGYSDQQNQGQQQEHATQSEAPNDLSPPDIPQQMQPVSGLDLRL